MFLRRTHHRYFAPAQRIGAHGLGDAAWGVRGSFFGHKSIIYGWRIGNVVQVATLSPMHGRRMRPNPALFTLRLARRLEALAQR